MSKCDKSVLEKYGITGTTEVLYNPSYEVLFNEETKESLQGYERGQETELGAVNVMTGIYTGRSPKDKFIVDDATSHDTVWWTTPEYPNDNHPASQEAWLYLQIRLCKTSDLFLNFAEILQSKLLTCLSITPKT